jgi:type IV secretory pathway component VirB8
LKIIIQTNIAEIVKRHSTNISQVAFQALIAMLNPHQSYYKRVSHLKTLFIQIVPARMRSITMTLKRI